jgi:hypothetical protein
LHTDRRYLLLVVSDGVSDRVDDVTLVQHVMKLSLLTSRSLSVQHRYNTRCIVTARSASTVGGDFLCETAVTCY